MEWLSKSQNGLALIAYYNKQNLLTPALRNVLTREVLRREYDCNPKYRPIEATRFLALAKEICTLFTTENPNTYYTAHVNLGLGNCVAAHGKLQFHNDYLVRKQNKQNLKLKRLIESSIEEGMYGVILCFLRGRNGNIRENVT